MSHRTATTIEDKDGIATNTTRYSYSSAIGTDDDDDDNGNDNDNDNSDGMMMMEGQGGVESHGSTIPTGARGNNNNNNPHQTTTTTLHQIAHVLRISTNMEAVSYEQLERIRTTHDRFAEGSQFSFTYNTLLLVSSVLAGLGLCNNSSTTIIASMLVSPLMGPVVAMAYGATVHDWKLVCTSLRTELLSLLVCIFIGAIIGVTCGMWSDLANAWPTPEMIFRSTWQELFISMPVAFFSGLAVAVSLVNGNSTDSEPASGLVGVAISASLLPPAVNAGILWVAYGFFEKNLLKPITVEDTTGTRDGMMGGQGSGTTTTTTAAMMEYHPTSTYQAYQFETFEQLKEHFQIGGAISLLLTITNVLLIIISSMVMFRLKEVRIRRKYIQKSGVFFFPLQIFFFFPTNQPP